MLGLLLLASTLFVGQKVVNFLPVKWYKIEFWAGSYVVGTALTTWAALCGAAIIDYNRGVPIAIGISVITAYLVNRFYNHNQKLPYESLTPKVRFTLILHIFFWSVVLWFLFTSRLFAVKPDGWYSGGTTWADLALHSTFIHAFADQEKLDLTSPVYATEKTTYPFLFDFNTALFFRSGITLQYALVLTSMLMSLSFLTLCFFTVLRLTKSVFVAQLTSIIFFFNSNTGSYYFFKEWAESPYSRLEFLQKLSKNYVHYPEYDLHWAQFITDYLLPQRGILMGLSVFIFVILLLTEVNQKQQKNQKNIRFLIALLVGLLPFFHIHTFLVLVGILGWYLLTKFFTHKEELFGWIKPLCVAALLATPQLYWQFSQTYGSDFSSFTNGWYATTEPTVFFWIRNLGLEFFFVIAGGAYLIYNSQKFTFIKLLAVPLTILFLACNIVIFQPNPWDNTKFMIYSHFIFSLLTAVILSMVWQQKYFGKIIFVVAFVVLTLGGGLAVARELETNWLSATNADIALAQFVRSNTKQSERFLTADTHNHPIPMLAGRSVILGYRGWLWTYGINYRTVEADVYDMYAGKPTAKNLLKKYKIAYVYIGSRELQEFGANEPFFANYPLMYSSEQARIYRIVD